MKGHVRVKKVFAFCCDVNFLYHYHFLGKLTYYLVLEKKRDQLIL